MSEDLSTSDEPCGICGEKLFTKFSITLSCNHSYHYECINQTCILSKKQGCQTCPYCRQNFKILEPVNGLKSLKYGVHWYSEPPVYENIKCDWERADSKNTSLPGTFYGHFESAWESADEKNLFCQAIFVWKY